MDWCKEDARLGYTDKILGAVVSTCDVPKKSLEGPT